MPQDDKSYIIFIHGFLGGQDNFKDISKFTERLGYHTICEEYSTFDGGVDALADAFLPKCIEKAAGANRIDIVSHSMGGLLLRSYLDKYEIPKLGRVVMIAPPNNGSEVADRMSQHEWWVDMFGDAGLDLRTSAKFPQFAPEIEFGVIGGSASWNYFSLDWISGDDDGWVGLSSTKLEGMKDHISVEASHGFITSNPSVIEQTAYFLSHGHFASNIKMEGSSVDINSVRKMQTKTGQYVEKLNSWYEELFEKGNKDNIKKARAQLAGEFETLNEWVQNWELQQKENTSKDKNNTTAL